MFRVFVGFPRMIWLIWFPLLLKTPPLTPLLSSFLISEVEVGICDGEYSFSL